MFSSLKPVFAPWPNAFWRNLFLLAPFKVAPRFTHSSPTLLIFSGLFSSSAFLGRLSPALILPLSVLSSVWHMVPSSLEVAVRWAIFSTFFDRLSHWPCMFLSRQHLHFHLSRSPSHATQTPKMKHNKSVRKINTYMETKGARAIMDESKIDTINPIMADKTTGRLFKMMALRKITTSTNWLQNSENKSNNPMKYKSWTYSTCSTVHQLCYGAGEIMRPLAVWLHIWLSTLAWAEDLFCKLFPRNQTVSSWN